MKNLSRGTSAGSGGAGNPPAPDWIPAFAGMTVIVGGGVRAFWIPAKAGMTGLEAPSGAGPSSSDGAVGEGGLGAIPGNSAQKRSFALIPSCGRAPPEAIH